MIGADPEPERLVDVGLIASLLPQRRKIGDGLIAAAPAMFGNDVDQSALHILGHALGVATDVEVRALLEPGPDPLPRWRIRSCT